MLCTNELWTGILEVFDCLVRPEGRDLLRVFFLSAVIYFTFII